MCLYEERLGVPGRWFWLAFAPGVMAAGVLSPFGPVAALVGLVTVAAAAALVLRVYGAAGITVTHSHLTAGEVRIPVASLGLAEILDAEEAFLWRTRRANGHALMLLRGYVPTALRIEIVDPRWSAPYIYLSTRRPATLVAVLAFARR